MDLINRTSPLRILLVEDNKDDRLAFRRAFQKGGPACQITACVRAGDALVRLQTEPSSFDLVVIDHELPGRSGLDLCREILKRGVKLPLVILTGRGSEQLAVEALKIGVDDYLIKDPGQSYLKLLPIVLPDVVGKYGDRSARKQAEEALRESEERFRRTVQGCEAGYVFIDRDGRIGDVNEAWLRMHGYGSRDEVVGKPFTSAVPDQDKESVQRDFERLLTGEPIPAGESRNYCKDGFIRHHTFSANPVLKGGKIIGAEAFLIDITERKEAEEEVRKVNEELKSFAHIVSHDLKTPIVFIQGYSSLLLEKGSDNLGERGRICVERIKASARRMELLISDLLALSRTGRVVAAFKDVSSYEVISNVVADLQDKLKSSGVEVVIARNLPVVHGDGERLYQVFDNLIANAIKFTRSAAKPKVEIGYEDKGEYHQFFVRDNGIGIDPKYHHKIFERFCRLKETQDEEGTGLGLAIIERIINNHGGKAWVSSAKGEGATFYLTIPKEHKAFPSCLDNDADPAEAHSGRPSILPPP